MLRARGPDEVTSRRILAIKIAVVVVGIVVAISYAIYSWLSRA